MNSSRVAPIALLATTVLPVTVSLIPMVLFGSIFWIMGVIDFVMGNYGLKEFQSSSRPDIALLFITAPLGLIGLATLWVFLISEIRRNPIVHRPRLIAGLCCGTIALAHMAYIKFLLILLLLPTTFYAFYKLIMPLPQGQSKNSGPTT